jgi:hypothetical protein
LTSLSARGYAGEAGYLGAVLAEMHIRSDFRLKQDEVQCPLCSS